MFRTSLANATIHRTCKPLHERHQATPYATFLDSTETRDVYTGMVMTKSGANTVKLCDGAADDVFGIAALDKNDSINDLDGLSDLLLFSIWQGGPDAYFIVDAPAFDTAAVAGYALSANESVPLYAGTGVGVVGKISSDAPGGNGQALAQLIEVVSATRIVIRLMAPPLVP